MTSNPGTAETADLRPWLRPLVERFAPWLLLVAAVLVRIAWQATQTVQRPNLGEADRVTDAFMRTGAIADAFHAGQGPTAHLMPLTPMVAGTIYRLFGWHSGMSEAMLAVWSLFLVLLSFMLLFKAFALLGSPLSARLGALAVLCLAPLAYSLETVWFRVWEGGLAAALSAGFLTLLLTLDARTMPVRLRQVGFVALLAAAAFFVSPPVGAAAYLAALVLMVRRLPTRRWPATAAITLAILVAVLAPWTLRNVTVMHAPIPLRDNFGLELALANYPEAVNAPDRAAEFRRHYAETHPFVTERAYRKMVAAGGEVAYAAKLGDQAKAWIVANPADFVRLTVRHLTEIVFPPAWYWSFWLERPGNSTYLKMALHYAISVFGLLGIVFGLRRCARKYAYVAIMTLVPLLPYLLVQPTLRYRYVSLALLVFLGADVIGRFLVRRRVAVA